VRVRKEAVAAGLGGLTSDFGVARKGKCNYEQDNQLLVRFDQESQGCSQFLITTC
jgi:hypothetical protein